MLASMEALPLSPYGINALAALSMADLDEDNTASVVALWERWAQRLATLKPESREIKAWFALKKDHLQGWARPLRGLAGSAIHNRPENVALAQNALALGLLHPVTQPQAIKALVSWKTAWENGDFPSEMTPWSETVKACLVSELAMSAATQKTGKNLSTSKAALLDLRWPESPAPARSRPRM